MSYLLTDTSTISGRSVKFSRECKAFQPGQSRHFTHDIPLIRLILAEKMLMNQSHTWRERRITSAYARRPFSRQ